MKPREQTRECVKTRERFQPMRVSLAGWREDHAATEATSSPNMSVGWKQVSTTFSFSLLSQSPTGTMEPQSIAESSLGGGEEKNEHFRAVERVDGEVSTTPNLSSGHSLNRRIDRAQKERQKGSRWGIEKVRHYSSLPPSCQMIKDHHANRISSRGRLRERHEKEKEKEEKLKKGTKLCW